ncbi:MAG: ABC transporter ATP-binding protein [Methanobacteriota archaeon]
MREASVVVNESELVVMIGPNGAGKSTFLKTIFGLIPARAGRVLLHGRDVTTASVQARVAQGIAYVPQVNNVFPNLSIRENLDLGAFGRGGRADLDRVHALFPFLAKRPGGKVRNLSGGERQMVAMGRALVADPAVLLLDEPTAGLAPNLADQVLDKILEIARSGVPVLLVEQNAKKSLARADRGYVIDQGKNAFQGTGRELLENPDVGRLYLGG